MKRTASLAWSIIFTFVAPCFAEPLERDQQRTIRVAAAQAQRRTIDYHLTAHEALAAVERNLAHLEKIVEHAGEAGCDALCLPEDTLGLLNWVGMNEADRAKVLSQAVPRMNERLGRAAAEHGMYLVTCSDVAASDGELSITAFLLGRDGRQIGRYQKVCPTWHEGRRPGTSLPVFSTPELGNVGMLICYDLVFPETARALALQGADVIFFPTMGGAAIGLGDWWLAPAGGQRPIAGDVYRRKEPAYARCFET